MRNVSHLILCYFHHQIDSVKYCWFCETMDVADNVNSTLACHDNIITDSYFENDSFHYGVYILLLFFSPRNVLYAHDISFMLKIQVIFIAHNVRNNIGYEIFDVKK